MTSEVSRSPVTFGTVRAMSRIRSTPRMSAIPSPGTPTIPSTITRSGIEPPGTPAVPIAVSTDIATTTACMGRLSGTPKTCARKSTVIPSKSAVPFMLSVAPSGITKPATSRGTPNSSWAVRSVVGSVALELEVENAVTMSSRARRKKTPGRTPASTRARSPITPNWCSVSPRSTITT